MSGTCVTCGASEPFGIGFCVRCAPSHGRGTALVFADVHACSQDRGALKDEMFALIGAPLDSSAGRAALRGHRALVQLPAALAERVAAHLSENGIAARVLRPEAAWTCMPPHFFLMLMLVMVLGGIAGARALPMMTWSTPLVAALLGLAAQTGMKRPLLGSGLQRAGLSSEARTAAAVAFSELGCGQSRGLLSDIVRLSDGVRAADPTLADLDDLVIAAAATAREVARLDETRAVLRQRSSPEDVVTRCDLAHANGTELLHRAVTALGRITAAASGDSSASVQQLGGLVREMEIEARARAEAAREVKALLVS